jgi:hypothetical protein
MKKLILLLFLLNTLLSFGQEVPLDFKEITVENREPGRCYYSSLIDVPAEVKNKEKGRPFVLEVIPPIYENVEIALQYKDFKSQLDKNEPIRYITSKVHAKFIRRESNTPDYNTSETPNAFMYCLIEVSPYGRTIFKKDFENDSLLIIEKRLIEESKIIITYVDAKPDNLNENQSFFSGGYWSEHKEVIRASRCGGSRTIIIDMQKALKELGYDLELNNFFDEKTKNALTHFQRKNGLDENRIDKETIEKLGVKY